MRPFSISGAKIMATSARKKLIPIENEQPQVFEREPLLDEMMYDGASLSPALQMLFSQMGLSEETIAEVFVYKDPCDPKKTWPGVWRGIPDDYDLEEIAKVHGSGDYRIAVYITANGHKTKQGEVKLAWMLSKADEEARLAPPKLPQVETVTKNDIVTAVAEAMRAMMPVVQQAPAMNPMEMFTMSLNMAKLLQPAQSNNDPLAMMKLFLEMQQSIKQENSSETKEVGATTNDLLLGLIDKFGEPLAQIVMAGQAQQATAQQPGQQLPQEQAIAYNPAIPQQNPIDEEETNNMQQSAEKQLKLGIGYLVIQAQAGNPYETYAEVAIDAVPEQALDEILQNPDPVAWMATFDPRVNEHKEWFKNMLDEIKKILSSSDETSV